MVKEYFPFDPCWQTWRSFINTVCPQCSKMQILFKVQAYRKGKHHKNLNNLECLDALLEKTYG